MNILTITYGLLVIRIIFVLLFSFFTMFHVAHASDVCQQRYCMAVVDAGSTGSRLHLYAYDLDDTQAPTQIDELWSHAIHPGFSTLSSQQSEVDAYLSDLFTDVPEHDFPVYFYSTAGMRILPQKKQAALYDALHRWFEHEPSYQLMASKTITGRDEGILGWLAVNYRLDTQEGNDRAQVGVMDIGGASVQVVFPVASSTGLSDEDHVVIRWHGQSVTLYAHSFLGLGQTLVMGQFLNMPQCFPQGYVLPDGLVGSGNAMACQESIASLVNGVHGVDARVGPGMKAAVSPLTWYTMGAATYLLHDGLFDLERETFTPGGLLDEMNHKACEVSWDSLQHAVSADGQLFSACLRSSYYYALMVSGYGVSPEESLHVFPKDENIDWSLGAILHQL